MVKLPGVSLYLFLLVLFGFAVPSATAAERGTDRKAIAGSLSRVEALFRGKAVPGDVAYFLGQGSRISGRRLDFTLDPRVEQNKFKHPISLEYQLWVFRKQPLPSGGAARNKVSVSPGFQASRAMALRTDGPGFPAEHNRQLSRLLEIMSNVLSCQGQTDLPRMLGAPDYGYVSAHQLASYVFAYHRGCLDSFGYMQVEGPYLSRVWSEFTLNLLDLTDLQVERAAVLMMVGRQDLVPPAFIQALLRAQHPLGGWVLDDPMRKRGVMPLEHTAALAYFVLSVAYASGKS